VVDLGGLISTVITDIGVFDVRGDHFSVREMAPGAPALDPELAKTLRPGR
jgi:3-oxoacid CoA-transferase subunit B